MSSELEAKNFLNQIKSEARADKVWQFFAKHKNLSKKLVIVFAIFLAGFFIFSLIHNSLQEKYSEILHQSLIDEEMGDFAKTQEALQEIADATFAPSGVKGLASLRYAGLLLRMGKKDEALKIYQETAFSVFYDDFVQETAGLLAAKLLINDVNKNSDKSMQDNVTEQVEKIVNNNKILKDLTLEQQAILMIKIDNKIKAREILEKIVKSEKAVQSLKSRAADLIKLTN